MSSPFGPSPPSSSSSSCSLRESPTRTLSFITRRRFSNPLLPPQTDLQTHLQCLAFSLTPEETAAAREDRLRVHVRLDVSGSAGANFRKLAVNNKSLASSRLPAFAVGTPIDVTYFCRKSKRAEKEEKDHFVDLEWTHSFDDDKGGPVVVVVLVRLFQKPSVEQLLRGLEGKFRLSKGPEVTADMVRKRLKKEDCQGEGREVTTVTTTRSCRVSLICPIGKVRMIHPCRSRTCDHLQCFDAKHFLTMNETSPRWRCPVCNCKATVDDIFLDKYFQDILDSPLLPEGDGEVVLLEDGGWRPLVLPDASSVVDVSSQEDDGQGPTSISGRVKKEPEQASIGYGGSNVGAGYGFKNRSV